MTVIFHTIDDLSQHLVCFVVNIRIVFYADCLDKQLGAKSGEHVKSRSFISSMAQVELPTLALIVGTYALWAFIVFDPFAMHPVLWIVLHALVVTFFMSITHEVLHRHPTPNDFLNSLLILLPIAWSVPYERFRDTHMAHHKTGDLTDPFDDPESWYLPQAQWQAFHRVQQMILLFNNTLIGRMLIGPILGLELSLPLIWMELRFRLF